MCEDAISFVLHVDATDQADASSNLGAQQMKDGEQIWYERRIEQVYTHF
jgi:hypothetical protein